MVSRPFAAGQFTDRRILTVVNLRLPISGVDRLQIDWFWLRSRIYAVLGFLDFSGGVGEGVECF